MRAFSSAALALVFVFFARPSAANGKRTFDLALELFRQSPSDATLSAVRSVWHDLVSTPRGAKAVARELLSSAYQAGVNMDGQLALWQGSPRADILARGRDTLLGISGEALTKAGLKSLPAELAPIRRKALQTFLRQIKESAELSYDKAPLNEEMRRWTIRLAKLFPERAPGKVIRGAQSTMARIWLAGKNEQVAFGTRIIGKGLDKTGAYLRIAKEANQAIKESLPAVPSSQLMGFVHAYARNKARIKAIMVKK